MRKLITDDKLKEPEPVPDDSGEWCIVRHSSDPSKVGPIGQDVWTLMRFPSQAAAVKALGLCNLDMKATPLSALTFTLWEMLAARTMPDGTRFKGHERKVCCGTYVSCIHAKATRMMELAEAGDALYTTFRLDSEITDSRYANNPSTGGMVSYGRY